ncbi:lonely Cys domain-containing protein [Streptomyces sp. GKU 257-1]|nr:lonely Cys domain-containing protein [Streptomyces sp. GKU 257-1]
MERPPPGRARHAARPAGLGTHRRAEPHGPRGAAAPRVRAVRPARADPLPLAGAGPADGTGSQAGPGRCGLEPPRDRLPPRRRGPPLLRLHLDGTRHGGGPARRTHPSLQPARGGQELLPPPSGAEHRRRHPARAALDQGRDTAAALREQPRGSGTRLLAHAVRAGPRGGGEQSARGVAHQAALAGLPLDHPLVLLNCYGGLSASRGSLPNPTVTGGRPDGADPLADVAYGQLVANETGRTVYTTPFSNAVVEMRRLRPGSRSEEPVLSLYTDEREPAAEWTVFRPEPKGAALDAVARAAGLHQDAGPAPEEVRERTLRLVRALRLVFGARVEDRTDYRDLLSGIGALELMRSRDPALNQPGALRFTVELFEELARAHHRLRGPGVSRGSLADGYALLLADAARVWSTARGLPLSGWLPLPHLTSAQRDSDAVVRDTLGLGTAAEVTEDDRSRTLWARIRTDQHWPGSRTGGRSPSTSCCCPVPRPSASTRPPPRCAGRWPPAGTPGASRSWPRTAWSGRVPCRTPRCRRTAAAPHGRGRSVSRTTLPPISTAPWSR